MYWFSMSAALLVSIGIIAIGAMYLARPATAMRSFGLPLPGDGESTMWWLRLKGVRDIAAGLLVLALMLRGTPQIVGIALLVDALIPLGDMSLILGAKGSTRAALSIHGVTALLMIAAGIPLVMGLA
ncbi:DUF4267 domain-containing protein [Mesorhizobium sp. M1338]|uniref:DUF4267 domain-containing protein n=1 Tax=Mesorhizobium sp. M1338 TaxID=2957085 RepID=UPI00333C2A30